MRAVVACLLVFFLAFNMVGSVLSFRISRQAVRRQSRLETNRTHHSLLTRFEFMPEDFEACHDGHNEMVINGEHYDIKHITYREGKIIVDARHDLHETKLVKEFVAWMKQKLLDDQPEQKRPQVKFSQLEFYCQVACLSFPVVISRGFYFSNDEPVLYASLSYTAPPPDAIAA